MDFIQKRFPRRYDMLAVFGVVVFVCYSWTLLGFLNKLSSFLLYFTLGEIANILAFMMAFALVESLVLTVILVLLSAFLPSDWLREGFAFKGFVIVIIATVTSILFQNILEDNFPHPLVLLLFILIPIGVAVALIALVRSAPKVHSLINNIQDRVLIMLFVYVPLGVLSLMFVLYRNLTY
ncbi:MAG TPA: hypothetical protein VFY26_06575 [Anaerolineales bacterium]|nr:hypothetical protein [Anaerolineales bacterium]